MFEMKIKSPGPHQFTNTLHLILTSEITQHLIQQSSSTSLAYK